MNFVILFVRKLAVFEEKYKIKSPETLRLQDFFGPSVIIGFQKTQIYQRFAGSRQEVFILHLDYALQVDSRFRPLFFLAFLDCYIILTFDHIFYAIPFSPQIINQILKCGHRYPAIVPNPFMEINWACNNA